MAHRARQDYPTPSPSPSPPPVVKQEDLSLSNLISSPHLESTRTLALALPEPQTQAQLNKEDRIPPCEQCRKVRRACRWVKMESAERSSCERCRKTGKQCSGPTRRSQTNLEIGQPLRQLHTRRQAVASIGPSSPESRWSTKHMSYSLTYHLVEAGLELLAVDFSFKPDEYQAFVFRFRNTQGRLENRASTDEALFPGGMDVPAFASLTDPNLIPRRSTIYGICRRAPLLSIARIIAGRVDDQSFAPEETQREASIKLSAWSYAIIFMDSIHEIASERLRLLKLIIQRCIDYLTARNLAKSDVASFHQYFQELVFSEIRASLLHGVSSTV
ncbi:hypothetical protein JCM5350_004136 [Sporobolomyces pararoseus]